MTSGRIAKALAVGLLVLLVAPGLASGAKRSHRYGVTPTVDGFTIYEWAVWVLSYSTWDWAKWCARGSAWSAAEWYHWFNTPEGNFSALSWARWWVGLWYDLPRPWSRL